MYQGVRNRYLLLVLLSFLSLSSLFTVHAEEKWIDDPHWIESNSAELNEKYSNGDDFVIMFYSTTCWNCANSKSRGQFLMPSLQ